MSVKNSYSYPHPVLGVSDDFTTSVMWGITSPERIILIIEPIPILLSFINLALKPVAY